MNTHRPNHGAGRAKSCIGCRQVKLACDATKNAPLPCSRCQKKGLVCRFDNNFKRVPTRKLVAQIHGELFTCSLNDVGISRTLPEAQQLRLERSDQLDAQPATSDLQNRLPASPMIPSSAWLSINEQDMLISYTTRSLTLDAAVIAALFGHFEAQYARQAIFLQPIVSLSKLLLKSPLLFWTIATVAASNHDQHSNLHERLAPEIDNLLAPVVQIAISRIETIHALLLLALWPIPKRRKMHDPSCNYAALATSAAMQLNCHRPSIRDTDATRWGGFGDQKEEELSHQCQSLTWLACFVTGTMSAHFQGFPPPFSSNQQLRSVEQALINVGTKLGRSCGALVEILKVATASMDPLGYLDDHNLHYSLTQLADDQLGIVKLSNHADWTSSLEVELCNARLQLYGLTFTIESPLTPDARAQRQIILLKAFDTACTLVSAVQELKARPAEVGFYPSGLLTFAPEQYFEALFNATAFLFRFLATRSGRQAADEGRALKSIIEAHRIFQSFPSQRNLVRAAIHTEMLVSIIRDKQRETSELDELVVKNRLGASVMLDAAFRAGKQRNRSPLTGQSKPLSEWKTLNETYTQRLPREPPQNTPEENVVDRSAGTDVGDDPAWWNVWDTYMDHFEVGLNQWPGLS